MFFLFAALQSMPNSKIQLVGGGGTGSKQVTPATKNSRSRMHTNPRSSSRVHSQVAPRARTVAWAELPSELPLPSQSSRAHGQLMPVPVSMPASSFSRPTSGQAARASSSRMGHVRVARVRLPPRPPYVPKEGFMAREERLRVQQVQAQAAKVIRLEQSRVFQRLVHFRDAALLTQQDDHPLLYPPDRPDVVAARAEYLAQMLHAGNPPNPRLLTQVNSEISAMSGEMTKDEVHFLAYDLERAQPIEGRTEYRAACRRFRIILSDIRDLPRLAREEAQRQSNRLKFQAVMKSSQEHHGMPGPWRNPPKMRW